MKFQTQWSDDYQPDKDQGGGVVLVETNGYKSANATIQELMDAGRQLMQNTQSRYDFGEEITDYDEYDCDPTRSGNFDLADAYQMTVAAEHHVVTKTREWEAAQASKKAQEAVDLAASEALKNDLTK